MARIRVLIADDSLTVRKRVAEALSADPEIEILGEAEDGKRAIELCQSLRPDIVTMDMMMPVMTGLAATEYIMAHCPTPILIVSSSMNRGEIFKTYDALAAGAVEVLEKPNGNEAEGQWERSLIQTVKLVARIRVITHLKGRLGSQTLAAQALAQTFASPGTGQSRIKIVAIGASTGGPGALVDVLRRIPASFPLPIVIVLHINQPFASAFADWLDGQSDHRVSFARSGDSMTNVVGRVVLAPADHHLIVRDGRFVLTDDPERYSCRPSVDTLFESVAREYGASAAGCLLTGMGRDGATGLLAIRNAGGVTIAQDEATSVVYGMPREAALLDAAGQILPLPEIGPAIAALCGEPKR